VGRPPGEDSWGKGDPYESYVGRWSRLVAAELLGALGVPPQARWLDVGCGTGALTQTLLEDCDPAQVVGVDPTADFVTTARRRVVDGRAAFALADARDLPVRDDAVDAAVSGLVLNFVPQRTGMLGEMRRVVRPGGTVACYVWDYAGGMELMRYFWDVAVEIDPAAHAQRESARFGFCRPEPLRAMATTAGLADVEVFPIDVPTVFADFDDYWTPFLVAQAPAPSYAQSLDEADRDELRDALRRRLPTADDGSIALTARAWVVRGVS
jgi:ubiquinone/menaquinone biosynthesis C-methylase UbiE